MKRSFCLLTKNIFQNINLFFFNTEIQRYGGSQRFLCVTHDLCISVLKKKVS